MCARTGAFRVLHKEQRAATRKEHANKKAHNKTTKKNKMKRAPTATNGTLGEKRKGWEAGQGLEQPPCSRVRQNRRAQCMKHGKRSWSRVLERRIHKPESPVLQLYFDTLFYHEFSIKQIRSRAARAQHKHSTQLRATRREENMTHTTRPQHTRPKYSTRPPVSTVSASDASRHPY